MIHISSDVIARIEICLRSEPIAVVGERTASLPEDAVVDDAADDPDDGLARPVIFRGKKTQPIAGGMNDDTFQRIGAMTVEYSGGVIRRVFERRGRDG